MQLTLRKLYIIDDLTLKLRRCGHYGAIEMSDIAFPPFLSNWAWCLLANSGSCFRRITNRGGSFGSCCRKFCRTDVTPTGLNIKRLASAQTEDKL